MIPVSPSLEKSLNRILPSDSVPLTWRKSIVFISKNGDVEDSGNYKPVSLTSDVCKPMTHFLKSILTNILCYALVLGNGRHDLAWKRSRLANLLKKMVKLIDRCTDVNLAFRYFVKVFELVNHILLISYIPICLFELRFFCWSALFYSGDAHNGDPQGSTFGAFRFLDYINNLSYKILIFTDDVKITPTHSESASLKNTCKKGLHWTDDLDAPIKTNMCVHVAVDQLNHHQFGLNPHDLNTTICSQSSTFHLTYDHNVYSNFRSAVNTARAVLVLVRSFSELSLRLMFHLYRVLVHSHLQYGIQYCAVGWQRDRWLV